MRTLFQPLFRISGKRFFITAFLLLWLSFSFNFFSAMTDESFVQNFKDSESLVVSSVVCKGAFADGQLAFDKAAGTREQYRCDFNRLEPYYSQYGLQGRVYTAGYKLASKLGLSASKYVVLAQLSTAALSAATLAGFIVWVRRTHSQVASIAVLVLLGMSPMIVGFARNLYWQLPLLFLPIMYGLYLYPSKKFFNKKIWFWTGLGILLYLRYLCGYEYITTLTVAALSGVVYHLFMERATLRKYINSAVVTWIVSVLAFSAAFATHVLSLSSYTGSVSSAIHIVKERALERTLRTDEYTKYAISGLKSNIPHVYAISDSYIHFEDKQGSLGWAIVAAVLNYAMVPAVSVPIELKGVFGEIIQSSLVLALLVLLLYKKRKKIFITADKQEVNVLFFLATLGLFGYISWLLLASSHALVHAHINGILLYMPFALFSFVLIGVAIDEGYKRIRETIWEKKTRTR